MAVTDLGRIKNSVMRQWEAISQVGEEDAK